MPPDSLLFVGIPLGFLIAVLIILRILGGQKATRIVRSLQSQPSTETFSESMLADLPPLAKRYFLHAIQPGTPLASSVCIRKRTRMFALNRKWITVNRRAIIAPPLGFVTNSSTAAIFGRVTRTDCRLPDAARMRGWLWGIIPVFTRANGHLARAAPGELALLSVLLPSALLPQRHVQWVQLDEDTVRAVWTLYDQTVSLTLTLSPDGRVRKFVSTLWADPENTSEFAYIPCGAKVEEERTFGGYTIPTRTAGGWRFGTPHYSETSRSTIHSAEFH